MNTAPLRNGSVVTDFIENGDKVTAVAVCVPCNALLETAELHELGEFTGEHRGH